MEHFTSELARAESYAIAVVKTLARVRRTLLRLDVKEEWSDNDRQAFDTVCRDARGCGLKITFGSTNIEAKFKTPDVW